MAFTLRPYQDEARKQVNTLLNNKRHPVFVSPTGTGKTKTAVAIIQDRVALNGIVYILVPQEEIFNQWVKDLAEAGLNPGMVKDGKILGYQRKVYVVMPLTLINMLEHIPESIHPTDIVTDECHHSEATSWQAIYDFFPNAVRPGLTATPKRTDGLPLSNTYTDIVSTITMKEAIDNGYLAKPLCIVPEKYAIDVPIVNGDYDPKQQAMKLGQPKIIGNVIDSYNRVFCGKPVIVACCCYEHAAQMTKEFNDFGWNFEHLHSKLSAIDRKAIIEKVRKGLINGVCTVGIGIEGMDIPGLYGLIWLRRTLSITIYLQFCGRVLRTMPGKEYGVILDPVGNIFIHGFPEADRTWSLEGADQENLEEEQRPLICPMCGTANFAGTVECELCGSLLIDDSKEMFNPHTTGKKKQIPSIAEGELVILDTEGRTEEIEAKIQYQKQIAEQERLRETEKRKAQETTVLTKAEKVNLFRRTMLQPTNRENFRDAIKMLGGKV